MSVIKYIYFSYHILTNCVLKTFQNIGQVHLLKHSIHAQENSTINEHLYS